MIPAVRRPALDDRLPPIRGRVQADAPLAPFTWFRVGGPAEALVRPSSPADLAGFLLALPPDVPVISRTTARSSSSSSRLPAPWPLPLVRPAPTAG